MRFFVLLTLCSVIGFILVVRMRPDLNPIGPSFKSQPQRTAAPNVPAVKRPPTKPAAIRSQRVQAPPTPSLDLANAGTTDHTPQNVESLESPDRPSFVQATVTSDVLPVYATNSATSRVLKVLNKGDLVETDLAVIGADGNWRLVRVLNQRISGYVRTEDLELKRSPRPVNQ